MKNEEKCPCNSGKAYGECCGPILDGAVKAETAEALMRARYCAYVTEHIAFLKTDVISSDSIYQEIIDIDRSHRLVIAHNLDVAHCTRLLDTSCLKHGMENSS